MICSSALELERHLLLGLCTALCQSLSSCFGADNYFQGITEDKEREQNMQR